jgi:hypothetical protein
MFEFLAKNHKDYSLYNRTKTLVPPSWPPPPYTPGITQSRSKPEYNWTETETKIFNTSKSLSIQISGKFEQFSGYTLSCKDTSSYSTYGGGVSFDYKVLVHTYEYYKMDSIKNLTKFIKSIPKKRRNKIVNIIYLFELNEEKTFFTYERLFSRLRTRLDFTFLSYGKTYQFDLIKPTFSLSGNRNRKINKLFRFLRKENEGINRQGHTEME